MLHKKIAYLFIVTLLLFSTEIKPSSNDQDESLGTLVVKWKHLEYQQSFRGRTENVENSLKKECCALCGLGLLTAGVGYALMKENKSNDRKTSRENNDSAIIAIVAELFNLSLSLGYSCKTLKKGCCDKPAQAKRDQEDVSVKMLKNYPFKDIEKAFDGNSSLFLAVKNVSKKME